MSVEKLTIKYEKGSLGSFTGELKVGFNPTQLAFSSSATWDRVEPTLGSKSANPGATIFRSVTPDTLTLTLFFDTYAPYPEAMGMLAAAGAALASAATSLVGGLGGSPPESVVKQTSAVMQLARVDAELHRPPVCRLVWGTTTLFSGVLQRSTRTYTMFWSDGTPVRATIECTFMELADTSAKVELHSADVAKTYLVKPGDTLMGIAAAHFGDGALWRRIADANSIEDPRALVPGRTLSIPRVR